MVTRGPRSPWSGISLAASQGVVVSDVIIRRRCPTVAEVAERLGYGESKVRMLIIQGDLKYFLEDGRSRHPAAVGQQLVESRADQAAAQWLD